MHTSWKEGRPCVYPLHVHVFEKEYFFVGMMQGLSCEIALRVEPEVELKGTPGAKMLANENDNLDGEVGDSILRTEEVVYYNIVKFLDIEGYPTEANESFKEANVSDLVYSIKSPSIFEFRSRRGRKGGAVREGESDHIYGQGDRRRGGICCGRSHFGGRRKICHHQ